MSENDPGCRNAIQDRDSSTAEDSVIDPIRIEGAVVSFTTDRDDSKPDYVELLPNGWVRLRDHHSYPTEFIPPHNIKEITTHE